MTRQNNNALPQSFFQSCSSSSSKTDGGGGDDGKFQTQTVDYWKCTYKFLSKLEKYGGLALLRREWTQTRENSIGTQTQNLPKIWFAWEGSNRVERKKTKRWFAKKYTLEFAPRVFLAMCLMCAFLSLSSLCKHAKLAFLFWFYGEVIIMMVVMTVVVGKSSKENIIVKSEDKVWNNNLPTKKERTFFCLEEHIK